MKKWIVIEGDNGAGKDTLAANLVQYGWRVVSWQTEAKQSEQRARSQSGCERVDAFLSYNALCGSMALDANYSSLVIRYWPSTLAAAYADHLLDWKEIESKVVYCLSSLPHPALIVYLKCDLQARQKRIAERGGNLDDTSLDRHDRHYQAIKWISRYIKDWVCVDTSSATPEVVAKMFLEIQNRLID
jgi:thymidylate kinase